MTARLLGFSYSTSSNYLDYYAIATCITVHRLNIQSIKNHFELVHRQTLLLWQ
jgi:hypothetical protein